MRRLSEEDSGRRGKFSAQTEISQSNYSSGRHSIKDPSKNELNSQHNKQLPKRKEGCWSRVTNWCGGNKKEKSNVPISERKISENQTDELTFIEKMQKERARNNWGIIRQYVNAMKFQKRIQSKVKITQERQAAGVDAPIIGNRRGTGLPATLGSMNWDPEPKTIEEKWNAFYINPHGKFNAFWDTISNSVLVMSYFIYPLVLIFNELLDDIRPLEIIFDVILIADMLVNLLTGYSVDTKLETSKIIIAKKYLRTYFIIDLLGTVPCLATLEAQYMYFMHFFRYFKFLVVLEHIKFMVRLILSDIIGIHDKSALFNTVNMITIMIMFFMVTHFFSCIWTYYGKDNEKGWWSLHPLHESEKPYENWELYIHGYFWVITTMTSVGYGDTTGHVTEEWLFAMALMFLGMAFFGVIMAEINLTLERSKTYKQFVDEIGEEFNLWLFKLDNVTKQRNMPPELFKSISKTVETMLSENYKLVFQDYPFYNQLTPRLQLELSDYIFAEIFEDFQAFFKDTEVEFKAKVVTSLQHRKVPANTIVCGPKDSPGHIYFILEGTIKIYYGGDVHHLISLKKNSFFGEISILLNINSAVSYKSHHEDVDVLVITKSEFNSILEDYEHSSAVLKNRAKLRRIAIRKLAYNKEKELKLADALEKEGMRRAKSDQTKPPSPSRDSRRGTVIHLKKMQRKKFNATNSKNIPTEEADALDDQEVRLTKEDIKQASIKRMALHDIKTLKLGMREVEITFGDLEERMSINSQIILSHLSKVVDDPAIPIPTLVKQCDTSISNIFQPNEENLCVKSEVTPKGELPMEDEFKFLKTNSREEEKERTFDILTKENEEDMDLEKKEEKQETYKSEYEKQYLGSEPGLEYNERIFHQKNASNLPMLPKEEQKDYIDNIDEMEIDSFTSEIIE